VEHIPVQQNTERYLVFDQTMGKGAHDLQMISLSGGVKHTSFIGKGTDNIDCGRGKRKACAYPLLFHTEPFPHITPCHLE
jgi:hypothetical protein